MENMHETLSKIAEETDSPTALSDDADLLTAASKDSVDPEYTKRNESYSQLLSHYIQTFKSRTRWNKWYKLVFFVVSLLMFVALLVASGFFIYTVAMKETTSLSDVAVVLSSLASIISAIIVLPRIIAEHLFPTDENKNMIDMVKNMQLNDSGIRGLFNGDKK